MKSKTVYLSLIFVFITSIFSTNLMASGGHDHSAHKKKDKKSIQVKGTQKVCPIRKKKIDNNAFTDFQGQRVYFCCQGCDKKFLKDPDTYFSEMKQRGEITESIQKKCPVTGDELEDHDVSVTLAGRKIYFCCKDCVKKFKKNKGKYLSRMDKAVKKSEHKHSHKH